MYKPTAAGTYVATEAMANKQFDIGANSWSGYNMKSFLGRVQYFREVCSPLKSFNSEATIKQYQADVRAVEQRADSHGKAQLS